MELSQRSASDSLVSSASIQTPRQFSPGINATVPPLTNAQTIMQRADEVNTLQRMLSDPQTSTVMLTGTPGAGKSYLAALLYNRLLLAKQKSLPAPRYMVWLEIGTYTTLPDMIAAILNGVNMHEPTLFMLKPEQQIATLLYALRRKQENALVVLDQFESLLHPETTHGAAGRGALALFLEMLQGDFGASRILLTSYSSPFGEHTEVQHVRSCLVTRISIPEGVALLQRCGVQGSSEEFSLVWQRCAGHVFALVLFAAIVRLSGISLSYLLNSPDYQPMWAGEVTVNLITALFYFLNVSQFALIRALSLFSQPVPLRGIIMAITGSSTWSDTNGDSYASFERELELLAQLSIVQKTTDSAKDVSLYSIHPLLRQFALEHYIDNNEQRRAEGLESLGINVQLSPTLDSPEALQIAQAAGHMQVAAYYQHIARHRGPRREMRKGLRDVEPIIFAVRHLCLGGRWQRACDLLFEEGLHESMVQWGAWNALIGIYTAMLPPFGRLTEADEALVYSHIAMLYGRMGEMQQSQSYFERALAIQRKHKELVLAEGATLLNQGELLREHGEMDIARKNFERALTIFKDRQDLQLLCIALHNLGLLAHGERDYLRAFDYYLEALQMAYRQKGQYTKGVVLTNLGILLYEQGQHREGVAILLAALSLRQAIHDPGSSSLERFLHTLEQKMGMSAYRTLCQEALDTQQQVFSRFITTDMRQ